jgi:hypothetical protein
MVSLLIESNTEPQSWKEYNTLSYPGPAWTQLPDTKGMFHARVVIRDSSVVVPFDCN